MGSSKFLAGDVLSGEDFLGDEECANREGGEMTGYVEVCFAGLRTGEGLGTGEAIFCVTSLSTRVVCSSRAVWNVMVGDCIVLVTVGLSCVEGSSTWNATSSFVSASRTGLKGCVDCVA
ncbi:hypothetical protein HYQ46_000813 [Verticillium longisporum]|nr:hypothetical protein HYQ46_000813 [Verticillium longisporum]